MSVERDIDRTLDVICQICKDGSIIPIKMRVTDESGETQQFKIKEYRELPYDGTYEMPNGAVVHRSKAFRKFECKFEVFGRTRRIKIIYNINNQTWLYEKGSIT